MVIIALCRIHRKTASFYGISFSAGTHTTSDPPFILPLAANLSIPRFKSEVEEEDPIFDVLDFFSSNPGFAAIIPSRRGVVR